MKETVLLGTTYFGPIQYFTRFLVFPRVKIEQYDNYSKQTYRNRCNIYGANGMLPLSIPVLKGPGHKTLVRDVRIDYSKNWRKLHWKGIESAYMHSPFFEFYMDEIKSYLEKEHDFLLDLNLEIMDYLLGSLEIDIRYELTGEYSESGEFMDSRDMIHPKTAFDKDQFYDAEPYSQVFKDRLGFMPNLSIIDLLFNEGPNARSVLERCSSGGLSA